MSIGGGLSFFFIVWGKYGPFIKVSQEINHLDPGELEGFDNALLALLMMLEFGGCSHKIGPNGSFDTGCGVDDIPESPSLASFVNTHFCDPCKLQ